MTSAPPFHLVGLDLRGRRVLVAGAGRVATRLIHAYLEAGAVVDVVAPHASDEVRALVGAGALRWAGREVADTDVDGAWLVLAATDRPDVNAAVARASERQRTFCVRADDADGGTARTAAHLDLDGFRVAVLGNRDPRGAMALRGRIAAALGPDVAG